MKSFFKEKGFTLIELLIVIAIIGIITSIVTLSFLEQTKTRSIQGEALSVLAILDQARSLAMSSKENTDFGVNISTSTLTLFKGSSYNQNDSSNSNESVAGGIELVNISLNGGGSQIVFERLTGQTLNYGTIKQ